MLTVQLKWPERVRDCLTFPYLGRSKTVPRAPAAAGCAGEQRCVSERSRTLRTDQIRRSARVLGPNAQCVSGGPVCEWDLGPIGQVYVIGAASCQMLSWVGALGRGRRPLGRVRTRPTTMRSPDESLSLGTA